ncbi:hypothetical protein Bca101_085166 [Brassica carinata]
MSGSCNLLQEHGESNGGSSSQPSKRPRRNPKDQNPNLKNLRRNPAASSTPADPTPAASPTPAGSLTQNGIEATRSAEGARSQDPPRASTQQDPPVKPHSGSSTKGRTRSSEEGEIPEEIGSNHGDTRTSQEHNATELGDDGDKSDPIVDGWSKIVIEDRVKILWDDLYTMDIKTRKKEHEPARICEEPEGPRVCKETEGPRVCEETEEGYESLETRLTKLMKEELKVRDDKIPQLEARIKSMEDDRNPRDGFGNMDDFFAHDRFDPVGAKENDGEKEPGKEGEKELEKEGEKEAAEKNDENEPEHMAEIDADKKATKEGDNELELMAADAEKLEKEAAEKEAAEKAAEKVNEDAEDHSPEDGEPLTRPKRLAKPSRAHQSPYVPK